jgi:amino acid transporter
VLGVGFGFLGLRETKDPARRGRGMAIAAIVIGLVLIAFTIVLVAAFATSDDCEWIDWRFECDFDS